MSDQTTGPIQPVQGVVGEHPDNAHPGECIGGFEKPTAEERLRQLRLRAAGKALDLDSIGLGPLLEEDAP